jgi:hypothetical protein
MFDEIHIINSNLNNIGNINIYGNLLDHQEYKKSQCHNKMKENDLIDLLDERIDESEKIKEFLKGGVFSKESSFKKKKEMEKQLKLSNQSTLY